MVKKVLVGVGVFAGLVTLLFVLTGVTVGWQVATAPWRGWAEKVERTQSASSRIYNYEHFYELCATIRSTEAQLDAQRELLEDVEDVDRVRENLAGLRSQRLRAIETYNADARKVKTRAQFLGDDLPRRIPPKPYEGEKTEC